MKKKIAVLAIAALTLGVGVLSVGAYTRDKGMWGVDTRDKGMWGFETGVTVCDKGMWG